MIKNISIRFRAAFLLAVFFLNTAVGFACAIGVDMGFNAKHHNETPVSPPIHVHADGKKHVHKKTGGHAHSRKAQAHEKSDSKDNCCKDKVVKMEQADKSRPASTIGVIVPLHSSALPVSFYHFNISEYGSDREKNIKQFVRCHHPPIQDIRIAIQSFQI
ncbi:hypothetical protein GWC95_05345 [Sediminibacterium roseum]|uniref:Uncharacterized protein n=1 Tax=Sediminibacterium roseum TaxID=1978412 RepID=A0ABW9ZQE3_9BACT|nr:hypothetical protein [Sediminibacterium roseum]NCI49336.1 hypothetical protein [Sediminibacterium roseum]